MYSPAVEGETYFFDTKCGQFIDLSRQQRHTNKAFDWFTNYSLPRRGGFPVFIVVCGLTSPRPFYEHNRYENNTYQISLWEKSLVHVMRVYFDRSTACRGTPTLKITPLQSNKLF